ncbi:hypothetical protein [uncultured Erythrobacter sp.]|uniref:hypothetical protein n=1 Tax=uncultured Erythrobacter sp. TaxID=263913 RepID=UPI002618FEDB|nr:hypothetical protein [uncultured Erythrobacter sp.]
MPEDSLLAGFGNDSDYRDCFIRDVSGGMNLERYLERFYCSRAFLPERLILKALCKPASSADARALAAGETDRFGVWQVVERREARSSSEAVVHSRSEALLESKPTGTASWFAIEAMDVGQSSSSSGAIGQKTRLYFGSWVGSINESGWNALLRPHLWYSRELLAAV